MPKAEDRFTSCPVASPQAALPVRSKAIVLPEVYPQLVVTLKVSLNEFKAG